MATTRFNRELNYRCRHFNGIQNKRCRAGVDYDSLPVKALHLNHPCHKQEKTICDRYDGYTTEELEQQRADFEARLEALRQNLSPCCRAELDMSHVITEGMFKNHGPRFCTKCGKVVYIV